MIKNKNENINYFFMEDFLKQPKHDSLRAVSYSFPCCIDIKLFILICKIMFTFSWNETHIIWDLVFAFFS